MTTMTQTATGPQEPLSPIPWRLVTPVHATSPGFAEIKKHNPDGLRDGLAQLRQGLLELRLSNSTTKPQPYLISYLPVRGGRPVNTTAATHLKVFAVQLPQRLPGSPTALLTQTWMDLGSIPIPTAANKFRTPREAHRFGRVVENPIRELFLRAVVRPTRRGGRQPSAHDVVWDELADFYRELAAELSPSGGSFRF